MSDSVYAKPTAPRIVFRPGVATVVLHILLLYVLTVNFNTNEPEVRKITPVPKVINATLVDVSELAPKPKPKPKPPAAKPKPKPKPKPQQQAKPKPKPKPVVKPKPAEKPAPKAEPKPEPKPEPRITEQELAEIARQDLARAMAAEEAQQSAATAGQLAASYAALIQRTVVNYWSRPPSARNGMEALLSLQLVPTGEVVSVTVVKSSGNTAFDRSAVNAVEKAGSFPELQNLPPGEFERTFRRFSLLFRPEDLRY